MAFNVQKTAQTARKQIKTCSKNVHGYLMQPKLRLYINSPAHFYMDFLKW